MIKIFKNISIIGSSHVAEESIREVKKHFKEISPDIVALELDKHRLYSLKNKVKRPKNIELIREFGITGFLFYIVGEFIQRKIGKIVDIDPGSEMLAALNLARKNNALIALIDRDITITLKRFSKHVKKTEFLKILFDSVTGKMNDLDVDFSKVPAEEIIQKVIGHTRKRYPSLFKVLIDERDSHMARQLHELVRLYPDKRILAVIGAGHLGGVMDYLNNENFPL